MNTPNLKAAALAYAKMFDWKVFPLHTPNPQTKSCGCGNPQCDSQGKHPRTLHGLDDATTDPTIIEKWWSQWPDANIGVVTDNLAVLDIDAAHGGDQILADLEHQYGKLPDTPTSLTGGGGQHKCFALPANGLKVKTTVKVSGWQGIDVRGHRGYIVAPPSIHVSGKMYTWEATLHPTSVPFAQMPDWLSDAVVEKPSTTLIQKNLPGWITDALQGLQPGNRHATFAKIIGRLHHDGMTAGDIETMLEPHAQRVSFPLNELRDEVESVCRYPNEPQESQGKFDSRPLNPYGGGNVFRSPIPITDLKDPNPIRWIWEGFLVEGGMSVCWGLWKLGKTTLIAAFLKAAALGEDFLGHKVVPVKVLVISEESEGLWQRRRDTFGLAANVHIYSRPFLGKPTWREWDQFVAHITYFIQQNGYRVIIIDPIATLSPIVSENEAGEWLKTLMALLKWMQLGVAVLLLHHPRKGDGSEGQAGRGSGALPGFVDIILELRRFVPEQITDPRRTMRGYSRYDETPQEIVIELQNDNTYKVLGDKADVKASERWVNISSLLPEVGPGMTPQDVLDNWPLSVMKPGLRTVAADLDDAAERKIVYRNGKGVKRDPYRYSRKAIPAPIEGNEAGIESGGVNPPNPTLQDETTPRDPTLEDPLGENQATWNESDPSPESDGQMEG